MSNTSITKELAYDSKIDYLKCADAALNVDLIIPTWEIVYYIGPDRLALTDTIKQSYTYEFIKTTDSTTTQYISEVPSKCPATATVIRNTLDYPTSQNVEITVDSLTAEDSNANEILSISVSTNEFIVESAPEETFQIEFTLDNVETLSMSVAITYNTC